MSHKPMDKKAEIMVNIIRGQILSFEEEIAEKKKIVLRYEALIKSIEKKGYYDAPTGYESDKQMKSWWVKQVGIKNIHWPKKKKK